MTLELILLDVEAREVVEDEAELVESVVSVKLVRDCVEMADGGSVEEVDGGSDEAVDAVLVKLK